MRSLVLATLVLGACGRLSFDERATPTDASPDVPTPAIAFVQKVDGNTGLVTSAQLTFPNPVGVHHAIIACIDTNSVTPVLTGVTDSLGHTYVTIAGPFDRPGFRHYIALVEDTSAGPDTLTITISSPASIQMYIHEYAGLATTASVDQTAAAIGTSIAPDGVQSGTRTTTFPHELIFGYSELSNSATAGTGFTRRSSFNGNVTEDLIVESIGTYQATGTMNAAGSWSMMMVTFRGR